jgi:hypothetical protein
VSRALGTACAGLALALAAHAVQRRVGTTDEVDVVNDDPRPRQLGTDRLPVGVVGVDRDDLDRAAIGLCKSLQIARHDASAAAVEDIQDTATVEVCDNSCELVPAAMGRLIQRQASWRSPIAPRLQLVSTDRERTRDLVARRALLPGDLRVRATAAAALTARRETAQLRAGAPATRGASR